MIRKELYIIRHGQTDHNLKGIVQGKGVNLPLNELGRSQSKAFFEAYKHVPFDSIYTSTLTRAQQTIYPFRDIGVPYEIFPELDEISWGEMEGSQIVMENSDVFKSLVDEWRAGNIDAKPKGGESPRELQERQKRFITHLLHTPHRNILISMHGRAIRSMMCTLTGTPLSKMEDFPHVNLTLYKLNLHDEGKFEIEKFNDTWHLANL
jgi:broad specificity phosphatase PhoE